MGADPLVFLVLFLPREKEEKNFCLLFVGTKSKGNKEKVFLKTIFWEKITLRYLSTQGSNRKVRAGIEPANMSFADSRLTTWPPHRNIKSVRPNYYSKKI